MNIQLCSALLIIVSFGTGMAQGAEITDTFATGDTLTAASLNNAKAAVNDNNARIGQNEADIAVLQDLVVELQSSLEAIQAQGTPTLVSENFYGDKLTFLTNTGDFRDCNPESCVLTTVNTGFEYYPLSGLNEVEVTIPADNTRAIVSTSGSATIANFGTAGVLDVGLFIDGVQPADGAKNFLLIRAGATNRSSGQQRWDMSVPVTLSAGTHTFSVRVKASDENEETISINNFGTIDSKINVTFIRFE